MQVAGKEKEIVVDIKPGTVHYYVYFKTGGELPRELQGLFVKKSEAERAVMLYKAKKATKKAKVVK